MDKIKLTLPTLFPSSLIASLSKSDQDLLQRWSTAFDAWLKMRHKTGYKMARTRALNAWRDFLDYKPILPWHVHRQDIEEWITHKLECGLQPSTLYQKTLELAGYFDYFSKSNQNESNNEFNPARGIKPDGFDHYKNAVPLCKEESEALLAAVDREESLLGQRDYALILMHLTTAQQPGIIRKLK